MAEGDRDDAPEGSGAERWLRVFVEDSALWPVLVVAIGIFATFGAALFVLVIEDRNPFALAALALLGATGSQALVAARRRRRIGVAGWIALAVAGTSILLAAAYLQLGD